MKIKANERPVGEVYLVIAKKDGHHYPASSHATRDAAEAARTSQSAYVMRADSFGPWAGGTLVRDVWGREWLV